MLTAMSKCHRGGWRHSHAAQMRPPPQSIHHCTITAPSLHHRYTITAPSLPPPYPQAEREAASLRVELRRISSPSRHNSLEEERQRWQEEASAAREAIVVQWKAEVATLQREVDQSLDRHRTITIQCHQCTITI